MVKYFENVVVSSFKMLKRILNFLKIILIENVK